MQSVRELFVGTSGYASPSSRSSLQASTAAATDLLAGYARLFGSVEMDSSFYRAPGYETVLGWRQATPETFRMCVRVPRQVTHVDRLTSPDLLLRFVESLAPLGPRLGCLLFTMPADLGCDVDRIRALLDVVPSGLVTAWEFRNPTWDCTDVLDAMVAHGAVPVVVETLDGVSGSHFLDRAARHQAVYVRFRRDRYRARELMAWGELLAETLDAGCDVYAFFRQSAEAMAYSVALSELLVAAVRDLDGEPEGGWETQPRPGWLADVRAH